MTKENDLDYAFLISEMRLQRLSNLIKITQPGCPGGRIPSQSCLTPEPLLFSLFLSVSLRQLHEKQQAGKILYSELYFLFFQPF